MKYYIAIIVLVSLFVYLLAISSDWGKGEKGFAYLILGMMALFTWIGYADRNNKKKRKKE